MATNPPTKHETWTTRFAAFNDLDEPLRDFVKREGGIINLPRPVMTDATTLILLPLSGVQPTWRNRLVAASRSKLTRIRWLGF